jgi:hypothetical protein
VGARSPGFTSADFINVENLTIEEVRQIAGLTIQA